MRKLLYISIYLLSTTIFNVSVQGQSIDPGGLTPLKDTKIFRFVSAKETTSKKVLFHNAITNAVELKTISSEVFNSTSGYLESFIVQPADNNGNVYIISAKKPAYYLKRVSNGENVSVNFATKKLTDDTSLYTWQILVGDNTGEVITFQVSGARQLGMYAAENGEFLQKYFTDLDGNRITNTINNEPLAPLFLFKKQSITNVF